MSYLLDTHVWLWMLAEPSRLSTTARRLIADTSVTLLLSAASSWEIAIKWQLGRLPLPQPPAEFVPDRIERSGVTPIPIEHDHVLRVSMLPPHHRDPFDRLLVAQAQALRVPILTADPKLSGYDVRVMMADADAPEGSPW